MSPSQSIFNLARKVRPSILESLAPRPNFRSLEIIYCVDNAPAPTPNKNRYVDLTAVNELPPDFYQPSQAAIGSRLYQLLTTTSLRFSSRCSSLVGSNECSESIRIPVWQNIYK